MGTASSAPTGSVYGGRGPIVMGVTWTLFALSIILYATRLYVKIVMKRAGNSAFVWITFSWVVAIVAQICLTITCVAYGGGNHIENLVSAGVIENVGFWIWLTSDLALISIALGKIAAVSLIVTILGLTMPRTRMLLWALAVVNVAFDVGDAIGLWFRYDPVPKLWKMTLEGECNGKSAVQYFSMATGAVNGATDFILAIFPCYLIWNLKASKTLKGGACLLLSIGAFTGICAAVKISVLPTITASVDPTYEIGKLLLWGLTEMWVVILVALIPPSYPIIQRFFNKNSGYTNHNGYNGSHGRPVYLSSDKEFAYELRNGGRKTTNGRSYVESSRVVDEPDGSTSHLPGNAVVMRQEYSVQTEVLGESSPQRKDSDETTSVELGRPPI